MPKEPLVTCEECVFFKPTARTLTVFPRHGSFMATGTCGNEQSPLHNRKLTGSFSPALNADHNGVGVISNAWCFTPKEN